MYTGSLYHGDIIQTLLRCVPDSYVRDYRDNNGYITVCRRYRTIKWGGQLSTQRREVDVPAETLVSLPRGFVTAASKYRGVRLIRPGWRQQFRRATHHLTYQQQRRITRMLGKGEVFAGVR